MIANLPTPINSIIIALLKRLSVASVLLLCVIVVKAQTTIYVSTTGNDAFDGSIHKPFLTLENAVIKALSLDGRDVHIFIRKGTYELRRTILINSANYLVRSLSIKPFNSEVVTISGSQRLKLIWTKYKGAIMQSSVKLDTIPDQLFSNGHTMPMARYPNYDLNARVYNGTAVDAIDDFRVATWNNPSGGYIHALHEGEWGDFHYLITGKDSKGKLFYQGGWQNNRPSAMHKEYRFVENIFEELNAPGEWFYDRKTKKIYLYPEKGQVLTNSIFSASRLTDLIHIKGNSSNPIKNISISGISFTQTARTFMQVKEPLLRSDWMIYRGGSILLDGTENVKISNCKFFELGGNAIFLSHYNKRDSISGNQIFNVGGNGIAFVGDPNAVRSPSFRYENFVPWAKMDFEKGSKTNNYPQYCIAYNNLIHRTGRIEKQSAGVQISMSFAITVSHNSIYDVPRAGINISEGTWGGHIIENNDVFNTVLETGDHGAFNSWGRDRFWSPNRNIIDSIAAARPGIELLDVISPIVIRNNRFQCDHGWDIDLDDGSSNYQIYNNVCLSGGLKLREGFERKVFNNIIINNTFHPHVWLKNSRDVFTGNIVTISYAPIQMLNWGAKVDRNYFLTKDALTSAQKLGIDQNSIEIVNVFVNQAQGDYSIRADVRIQGFDFKSFLMDFGVVSPKLKALVRHPAINPLLVRESAETAPNIHILGAEIKNINSLGERSAAGIPDYSGALIIAIKPNSLAEKSKLLVGDVIIAVDQHEIKTIDNLSSAYQNVKWMPSVSVVIYRNQVKMKIALYLK
ncbi:hypothetical protein ACVWYG_001230 [Pedobacter sp. UYEF25]